MLTTYQCKREGETRNCRRPSQVTENFTTGLLVLSEAQTVFVGTNNGELSRSGQHHLEFIASTNRNSVDLIFQSELLHRDSSGIGSRSEELAHATLVKLGTKGLDAGCIIHPAPVDACSLSSLLCISIKLGLHSKCWKVGGPIVFLLLFGAFVGTVCYIQFRELRDVQNRLDKLESIAVHRAYYGRRLKKDILKPRVVRNIQNLTPTMIPPTTAAVVNSHDCCADLAHPQFNDETKAKTSTNVTVGANANLHCGVTGNPPPSITWSFNGKELKGGSQYKLMNNNQSLTISHVQVKDDGYYRCEIENVFKKKSLDFKLNVTERIHIEVTPSNATFNESQPFTFECTVKGIPKPNITWNRVVDGVSTPLNSTKKQRCIPTDGQLLHRGS
ncbi:hypothetical protein ScPMuIL_003438 [Solemya velum]